jgi:hypothetical protein
MKTIRYLRLFLSMVFLAAGAYVLQDSVRSSGRFAEEGILFGALLSGFALVGMSWSIKVRVLAKAMERHVRDR